MIPATLLNGFFLRQALDLAPVIIVGMHRSGTTLLGDLLEKCGLFQGANLSFNRESVFFQNVNRDLLDVTGSSWRQLDFLPSHQEMQEGHDWMTARVQDHFRKGLIAEHFGAKALSLKQGAAWGWKEPRTSLFLPVYQRVFPQATVVHIYRDGRDVALSLLTRDLKRKGATPLCPARREARYVHDLQVWQSYCERIEAARPLFPTSHLVRYEELLLNPIEEMQKIIDVCNLKPKKSLQEVTSVLDPSRAGRVKKGDETWTKGLESHAPLLERFSYV